MPSVMQQVMRLHVRGPLSEHSLRAERIPIPKPGPGEVLLKVSACGVCATDRHVIEGKLAGGRLPIIPGHQIVGKVVKNGPGTEDFEIGSRIGVPWLRHTCGGCEFCRKGDENLCPKSSFTGHDSDGGFAEFAVAPARYVYRIPASIDDLHAAPLLCAGIIGYRALKTCVPRLTGEFEEHHLRGMVITLIGFGSSAHITIQIAKSLGARVLVATRRAEHQRLAMQLGADWSGNLGDLTEECHAAILFAPAGALVPEALDHIKHGGTLVCAGIYMSEIPSMSYNRIFHEKSIKTVEANTRKDGWELFRIAERGVITSSVTAFRLSETNQALIALESEGIEGSAVLVPD